MSSETTFMALLVVQALHLLHLAATHLTLCAIQIVGSIWIRRLSPA